MTLLDDIAKGDPALIGVDIDTSAPQFRDEFEEGKNWPPVVWEREVRELPENDTSYTLEPLDVLGGKPNLDYSKNSFGLGLLIDDADGVTRRYRRLIQTRAGPLASFP